MNQNFANYIELFSNRENRKLLVKGYWGLEKESQRVLSSGELALTPHPKAFGDKLTNPYITTDFSESQLEFITPPFESIEKSYDFLCELHNKANKILDNELLWPLSMPPKLPDEKLIPIAKFNNSPQGKEQEIYRKGLALRYGKKMQMICGVHYNFSFSDRLLDLLYQQKTLKIPKQEFINDLYFSLGRNFLRYKWLLIYLFGASPSFDSSYNSVLTKELEIIKHCCPQDLNFVDKYEQYATSLRLSRFGYSSTLQGKYSISYNSLKEYILGLRKLLNTPCKEYLKLGTVINGEITQLNTNVLQKESEFYSPIRFKQYLNKGENSLDALEKRGVKYIEIRILDLNPFEKTGLSLSQLYFLHVFMIFCLFEENKAISEEELTEINLNHHLVALSGRRSDLVLYDYNSKIKSLTDYGTETFKKLEIVALLMDKAVKDNKYTKSVLKEKEKLFDVSLLPSSLIYNETKNNNETFLEFGLRCAKNNLWR